MKIWNDKSKRTVYSSTYEPFRINIKASSTIYFTLVTDKYERDYIIKIKEDCEYEFRREPKNGAILPDDNKKKKTNAVAVPPTEFD